MVWQVLGGIGIFLLGILMLEDALKALAGDRFRTFLARFAGKPLPGILSGAGVTVLVQSSTATTLTAIGLVSAGILTFQQSFGIIYGANLGTTATGWLVALLGLQYSISVVALPVVAAGVLLRMMGGESWKTVGSGLAGFGLLFVGIDFLQAGMAGVAERVGIGAWDASGLGGILLLVLVGTLLTIVMQASAAVMATVLASLHAGAISFEQAAAVVVGQNIGTTFTAALAALGASTAGRRTAVLHIVFNLGSAVVVLLLFRPLLWTSQVLTAGGPEVVALAAFHTLFNVLGIVVFLPFTPFLSRAIVRIVPRRGPMLASQLEPVSSQVPTVAVEALRRGQREIARELLAVLLDRVRRARHRPEPVRAAAIGEALDRATHYLATLRSGPETEARRSHLVSVVHALDHLHRLRRLGDETVSLAPLRGQQLAQFRDSLETGLAAARDILVAEGNGHSDLAALAGIGEERNRLRRETLERIAAQELAADEGTRQLEALSWAERVAFHTRRAVHHLDAFPDPEAVAPPQTGT